MPSKSGSKTITGSRAGSGRRCRLAKFRNRMNEIVLDKRAIEADSAPRLARVFTASPQFWMRLQADWFLHWAMTCVAKASEPRQFTPPYFDS